MATISSLYVELKLQADNFNNGLKNAQKEAKEFQKVIKPTTELLTQIGTAATTAGKVLSVGLTAPIVAIAGLGVAFNSMQEQATIAFTTMLGDGRKAEAFLSELKDFAAKTPFEFPDLVRAAQRLMAMGFEAKEVKPLLSAVGNAVAGLGGGAAEIDRVTLALGQMSGRGKVATGEMNQLTEVGIPAWEMLAKGIGKTQSELRDMVEKGAVPAGRAIEILVAGMNDKFGGMTEKQAATFAGLVSTIKDESRFLAGELTEGFFEAIKGPAAAVMSAFHEVRVMMEGWSNETKAAIAVVGLLVAAIGPLLFVFGTMASSLNSMIGLYTQLTPLIWSSNGALTAFGANLKAIAMTGGPILLTVAAVAALAIALWKLKEAFDASNKAQDDAIMHTSEAAASTERAAKALKEKYGIAIEQGTLSTQAWAEAIAWAANRAAKLEEGTHKVTTATKANTVSAAAATAAAKAHIKELDNALKAWDRINDIIKANQSKMQDYTADIQGKMSQTVDKITDKWQNALSAIDRLVAANRDAMARHAEGVAADASRWLDVQTDAWERAQAQKIKGLDDTLKQGEKLNQEAGDRLQKATNEQAEAWRNAWSTAMGNVVSGFARGVADMIFEGKSFADSMVGIMKELGKTIVEILVTDAFTKVAHKLTGLLGEIPGLGGILGGGASAAGGIASSAGGAASSAGGIASSVGGGASSMTSGLISGGIAAAGSIIGAMMGEGNARRTEENTRETRDWLELQTVSWDPVFHAQFAFLRDWIMPAIVRAGDILWEIRSDVLPNMAGGVNVDGRAVASALVPHLLDLSRNSGVQIVGSR